MKSVHQDLMTLQTWFSPAFPTGAFSYSHGMESAIHNNLVKDAGSLKSWIDTLLSYGSGRNDGLFLKAAYEGFAQANALCLALCGSKERLRETMELGQAFSRVVRASYDVKLPDQLAYPVHEPFSQSTNQSTNPRHGGGVGPHGKWINNLEE